MFPAPTHRKRAKQQNRTTCHATHRRDLRSPGQQSVPSHQPASCHPSQPSQHCISHTHCTSTDLSRQPDRCVGRRAQTHAHAAREHHAISSAAVSAAPGRCRESSWPTWKTCSSFTSIGSMLKFEPILLPNGRDTACQNETGRQVGARTCWERLVCSSQDGGRLLTSCRRSSSRT